MGNQMFQYAYALRLQKLYPEIFIALNSFLHAYSRDSRQFSLGNFKLNEHTFSVSTVKRPLYFIKFCLKIACVAGLKTLFHMLRFNRRALSHYRERLMDKGVYCPTDAHDIPVPNLDLKYGDKYLYGYFQSISVIKGIEDILRDAFTIKTEPSRENMAMLEEICGCNSVCMHVRRGDYGLYPQYQVCDESYYRRALEQACELIDNPIFYIFTTGHEDVLWIKRHYHFNADVRYVDLDNPDYEELRLMMSCKHFVISNSTFSWWAAVLSNQCVSKKVWAPSIWYKGGEKVNMFADDWILL